ncbi:MAG TPA: formyl transferase [Solirubrobacteraceae bacterium]|nr:formyl transferase [Solirubrobacteraceae bacterium]
MTDRTPLKIVLLAADGMTTNIVFNAIEREHRLSGVIIEEPVPRRTYLLRRARRLGYVEAAGQALFQILVPPLLRRVSRRRVEEILASCGLDASPVPQSRVARVTSANATETHALLARLSPDVVVINGTRILGAATLAAVPARFVNVHTGITPMYRGVHGGYWALASSDVANCGVTVHEVDSGLDTGAVLHQARIAPSRRDNFVTYPLLQLGVALPLLLQYLAAPGAGVATDPHAPSRAWSHPTLWGYVKTYARTGVR